jgi:hypothetical protein
LPRPDELVYVTPA